MIVLIVAIVLVAVIAVVVAMLVTRRRRRTARERRTEEIRASLRGGMEAVDPRSRSGSSSNEDAPTGDPWHHVSGLDPDGSDPAGPPAAIIMAVTGADPWQPARAFLGEMTSTGYETTVELPDLLVLRDDQRLPVTVREPAGPPGRLIITSTPELLASTLETLVRSLLTDSFTVEGTNGRDVDLTNSHDVTIRLTVSELVSA